VPNVKHPRYTTGLLAVGICRQGRRSTGGLRPDVGISDARVADVNKTTSFGSLYQLVTVTV